MVENELEQNKPCWDNCFIIISCVDITRKEQKGFSPIQKEKVVQSAVLEQNRDNFKYFVHIDEAL